MVEEKRGFMDTLIRRKVLRGGLFAGGAAVLAACGETTVVEKTGIKDVPVERIVTIREEVPVEVEKIVEAEVPVESVLVLNDPWGVVTVEPGDTIKDWPGDGSGRGSG